MWSDSEYIHKRRLLFTSLAIGVLMSVYWILSKNNALIFDDYSNIFLAKNNSYEELFRFFPEKRYNDRCIAVIFIKLLYDIFGLNAQGYHFVFVLLHCFNVALVYKIIAILMIDQNRENKLICSCTGAAVFGIYPISLMAVSWISAEYEMVCSVFYLLCIFFYLKSKRDQKYRGFYSLACILMFYLALRSKEMAIVLPVIFCIYELGIYFNKKEKIQNIKLLILLLAIMCVFGGILFSKTDVSSLPEDNPYFQNYSFVGMLKSAVQYLLLYFDLNNPNFTYTDPSLSSWFGLILVVLIILYGIISLIRRRTISILLSICLIGVSLAPVLPLVNFRHRLYLYIPSIFVGITIAYVVMEIIQNKKQYETAFSATILFIILLILTNCAPGVQNLRKAWLEYCSNDMVDREQILKQKTLVDGCNVYIKGATNGYNIFFYGPGNSIRLFLNADNINVILVDEFPEEPELPYVLWEYEQGSLKEFDRDES